MSGFNRPTVIMFHTVQDYYGITFPGPTATLSGRDGSLANNPYSGIIILLIIIVIILSPVSSVSVPVCFLLRVFSFI